MNQKPAKKSNFTLRLFVVLILLGMLVIYSKILVIQIRQRAYVTSSNSTLAVRTIFIGVADYGQIVDMNVEIGSTVKQGQKIFTYLKSGTQPEEVAVQASVTGVVKEVINDLGSYITPDDKVLSIQADVIRIRSQFPISPDKIDSVRISNQTITTIPGKGQFNGKVALIYPVYDTEKGLLQIDSVLEVNPIGVLEGIPVQTKVYIGDDIATNLNKAIERIPFSFVRDYFNR